jgi:hypothetical protein
MISGQAEALDCARSLSPSAAAAPHWQLLKRHYT